jgi:hypothetical protein
VHKQPEVQKAIEQAVNEILAHRYLDARITNATVSEAELRSYYEQNRTQLVTPARVKARHIRSRAAPISPRLPLKSALNRQRARRAASWAGSRVES